MVDQVTIRRAQSVDDYHACQKAQRLAWGIADEAYVVPIATMIGAQLHGGLVLGAFLPSGEAIGLSFAFLGRSGGRLCLYSQLTGVVPGRQSLGLGHRLKLAQRDWARAKGIDLIAWAFDPLQAGNARFNLEKLGASAVRYVDNMYGPRTDRLNAGVPTDRLIAEWEVSVPPRPPLDLEAAARLPRLIETTARAVGESTVHALPLTGAPRMLLEIPDDIVPLRARDPALAEGWRRAVRAAFHVAFSTGYRASGFVRLESEGGPEHRGFYLLDRLEPER